MYIIHVGFLCFPTEGPVPVQRMTLTFKGLKQGYCALKINKENPCPNINLPKLNRNDRSPFIFTSLVTYPEAAMLKRNINKFKNYITECILLAKKQKRYIRPLPSLDWRLQCFLKACSFCQPGVNQIYIQDGISAILVNKYSHGSYVEKLPGVFSLKEILVK